MIEKKRNSKQSSGSTTSTSHFRKKLPTQNNLESAMESIKEEDEHQFSHQPARFSAQAAEELPIKFQKKVKKRISMHHEGKLQFHGPPQGAVVSQAPPDQCLQGVTLSSNFSLKNENNDLSTAQTSGGFSNKRSPRDPSQETGNKRDGSQIRLRQQFVNQASYNSLHQLRSVDKESLRLATKNSACNEFVGIIEEEEFAYQDEKRHYERDTAHSYNSRASSKAVSVERDSALIGRPAGTTLQKGRTHPSRGLLEQQHSQEADSSGITKLKPKERPL